MAEQIDPSLLKCPKLDTKKLTPIHREAEWDEDKKIAIRQAMEEYPHIPQIAIEACYDFAKKYENDATIDKYIKGEHLTDKQLKKVEKILHPNGYKLERNEYKDGQELKQVNIISATISQTENIGNLVNNDNMPQIIEVIKETEGSSGNDFIQIDGNVNEKTPADSGCKII